MTLYRLILSNRARKDLDRLQGKLWYRVRESLATLREEPRPHHSAKLRGGTATYRIRVGNYRIIYDVDDEAQTITILRIKHRPDVYRNL